MKDGIKVKGFLRIQLGEDKNGEQVVVGDSGWCNNTVSEDGFQHYIVGAVGGIAASKSVSHMQIATQSTAVNSTQESMLGETGARKTVDRTFSANGTLVCTASWSSTDHPGGTPDIGSLALYNTSSGGTMCAGQTFTAGTSTWNNNQNVSATYQLRFS